MVILCFRGILYSISEENDTSFTREAVICFRDAMGLRIACGREEQTSFQWRGQRVGPNYPPAASRCWKLPETVRGQCPCAMFRGAASAKVPLAKRHELSRWRRFGRFWDVLRYDQKRLSTSGNRVLGCGVAFYRHPKCRSPSPTTKRPPTRGRRQPLRSRKSLFDLAGEQPSSARNSNSASTSRTTWIQQTSTYR